MVPFYSLNVSSKEIVMIHFYQLNDTFLVYLACMNCFPYLTVSNGAFIIMPFKGFPVWFLHFQFILQAFQQLWFVDVTQLNEYSDYTETVVAHSA